MAPGRYNRGPRPLCLKAERCRETPVNGARDLAIERVTGIEPAQSAWKAVSPASFLLVNGLFSRRRAFHVPCVR
jgi:hypothetical protein